MRSLWQDLRYAVRVLGKSPGFTAVAVITLALGIGANTAIFSLINAIMLRTLPVKDPQRLVLLKWRAHRPAHPRFVYTHGGCPGDTGDLPTACSFSYPMFQRIHAEAKIFSGVFAFVPTELAITAGGRTSRVNGSFVSGDFFPTLGVRPALGRLFNPLDDASGAAPAVVVSYHFWQNVLSGDHAALGKSALIGKTLFTIVGVTPPRPLQLDPGVECDFWLPLSSQPALFPLPTRTAANAIWLQLMARLKPGVSIGQAASAMSTIFAAASTNGPEAIFAPSDAPRIELPTAAHGLATLRQAFSQPLLALLAAVALVLLIACANIAGLMLARSIARQKEMAMRAALGATRGRIIRQLLTESLLLSITGGAAGIFLGYWGAETLALFLTRNSIYVALRMDVHPDPQVLAFTLLVSALVGLGSGLVPAFSSCRIDSVSALKEGTGGFAGAANESRTAFGNLLVVVQIALAMVVLVGAGLLVSTLANLKAVNLGFNPQNLLTFQLDWTNSNRTGASLDNLYRNVQERLATLPWVISATYSSRRLLSNGGDENSIVAEDQPNTSIQVSQLNVAPDFFKTMAIPLRAGRTLNAQDSENAWSKNSYLLKTLVINETLARRLFGDQNPVGRHFRVGGVNAPLSEVVGVVGDGVYDSLRKPVMPTVFAPMTLWGGVFEVRSTAMDPKVLMPEIRTAITRFDPALLITDMKTQMEQIDQNIYQERLIANLSGLFALLALIVACVGIYGLLSYQVTRRTQEIGIRLALGAQRDDVLRIVLRQGMVLAIPGVLIGTAAALAVTRYLQSFLYGVKPSDPLTMVCVAFLLIAVALLASYIPARRAMKTDPMEALRYE